MMLRFTFDIFKIYILVLIRNSQSYLCLATPKIGSYVCLILYYTFLLVLSLYTCYF